MILNETAVQEAFNRRCPDTMKGLLLSIVGQLQESNKRLDELESILGQAVQIGKIISTAAPEQFNALKDAVDGMAVEISGMPLEQEPDTPAAANETVTQ